MLSRSHVCAALLLALCALPVRADSAAKVALKNGKEVEGRIEGRVIQKMRSGSYAIRDGSAITGIDRQGVHFKGGHSVELIMTGSLSTRVTGIAGPDKILDASPLLGELADSAPEGGADSFEARIVPKLRIRIAETGEIRTIAVKDIVTFDAATKTKDE